MDAARDFLGCIPVVRVSKKMTARKVQLYLSKISPH
jgi:hypothetical protein